jgi:hypothetical protein
LNRFRLSISPVNTRGIVVYITGNYGSVYTKLEKSQALRVGFEPIFDCASFHPGWESFRDLSSHPSNCNVNCVEAMDSLFGCREFML